MFPNLRCTVPVASTLLLAAGLALAAPHAPKAPKPPTSAPHAPVLPRPTGTFAVGTTVAYLTDSARTAGPPGGEFPRPITVQLWYPTNDSTGARESYLVEPGLAAAVVSSGYNQVDSTTLRAWSGLTTAALRDARMATGIHRLVTLSHGLGNLRASYTAFAIDLASHGIVVAAIDHPYGGLAVTPLGRVLTAGDDSTNWDDIATHARRMDEWAMDIRFVLDWLAGTPTGVAGAVSRGVDWRRIGAIGHSSGGLAAVQATSRSDRIRVAVDMDGGLVSPEGTPLAAFVREGFTRPTLIVKSHPLYSEADLKRRGKTQAQYDAAAKAAEAALDSVPKGPTAPVFTASIAGTGHMSFSDAPFVMPTTITRFGGKVIDPERGYVLTSGVVMAFLDEYLRTGRVRPQTTTALQTTLAQYPEVTLRQAR